MVAKVEFVYMLLVARAGEAAKSGKKKRCLVVLSVSELLALSLIYIRL